MINIEGDPLSTNIGNCNESRGTEDRNRSGGSSCKLKEYGEILQEKHNDFGKLKGQAVKLHIDPNVNLAAQPIRRTPFSLR